MTDPYSVLGLKPGATDDEVKKAYKRLAKKYHPDIAGNSAEAQKKMQEINAAYDAIINHKGSYQSSYSYQGGYSESENDEPIELRAAVAYINARRYMEALNTLNSIPAERRSGRWYYLSAYTKAHVGDSIGAMNDINAAIAREPGNITYISFRDGLSGRRTQYEDFSRSFGNISTGFFPCCFPLFPFFPCCCII